MKRLLLAVLLLAACATTQHPTARFKILQINDVYKIEGLEGGNSGGLARVRTLRKHLEGDGTPVLVLHGGDLLYPSVMSKYLEAKPMLDIMNRLDGDPAKDDENLVVGFGNHEFDNRTADILLQRLNESQFQWIATNTHWCHPACDQRFPKTSDIREYTFNGVKVAVFGILYPFRKPYAQATDVLEAAADAVHVAREHGAKVVIAVTHQDMADDLNMARKVLGIDLVIGGHDHLYTLGQVERTWISKADADAKTAIVYDVTVDNAGVHTTPLRIVLDTSIPKDKDVDARVQYWLGELAQKLGGNEPIAMTANMLEGVEPVVRGRESALGNMLTDVMREHMGTDVAILNGGSIRINDNIPPGPITKYDMEGVFYFTNRIVAFTATGQQLLDLLRHGVSRADAGDGRFLQVSGVSFAYRRVNDDYVVNASDVKVNGNPLDVNATYSIATIDYLYERGEDDGFTLFSDATRPAKIHIDREADLRATVEAWLRQQGKIDTGVEGRIVRNE
ncbi:MAG TPA: bifunctional UDP-sugar hydrolase/5'-nucleotidase [Thermoanaerobaculia bacterium]|nr:bifunctional UDP-sugar hydrolase/5'-nucleotidase [Thermoanaerobaculia bacterium]